MFVEAAVFVFGLILSIGGGLLGSFVLTLIGLMCFGKCSEEEIKYQIQMTV